MHWDPATLFYRGESRALLYVSCSRWGKTHLVALFPDVHCGNFWVIFPESYLCIGRGNWIFRGCLDLVLLVRAVKRTFSCSFIANTRKKLWSSVSLAFSSRNELCLKVILGSVYVKNVCWWIWIGIWTILSNLLSHFAKSRYTIPTETSFSETVNHTSENLTPDQSRGKVFS